MEAIVYHTVIHLLMDALGFIILLNEGRRGNFYLGQDWKYSKLLVQIHATAGSIWVLCKCHHLPWATWASGPIFQPGSSDLPRKVLAWHPAPGKRKKLLNQTGWCQNFAAAILTLMFWVEAVSLKRTAQWKVASRFLWPCQAYFELVLGNSTQLQSKQLSWGLQQLFSSVQSSHIAHCKGNIRCQ